MGILGRINRVIKSNVNELLDKMSDPAKEIDLMLQDMEDGLRQAREEVVTQTAAAKRSGMRVDELQRQAASWERRAVQALQGGDEELAKEALARKLESEQELGQVRQTHSQQLAYADELKGSLKQLEAKLKDVRARKESLKARAKAAKDGGGPLPGSKAFAEFSRLEDKISSLEEMGELTGSFDGRDAATEAKFSRLEQENPQLDDALAELKRKMDQEG